MKCPKCNYVSHDYLDTCRKCRMNLAVFKQQSGLFVLQPGLLDLSVVLGNRADDDPFSNRLEEADTRGGVDDFDISLDDYADNPVTRRASGAFSRPGTPQESGDLQHLTLQLDASAISAEIPRNIVRPAAGNLRSPGSQGPPPLPPVNLLGGTTDSPTGHLTLDLDAPGSSMNLVSGIFPQLPREGSPRPPQPAGMERRKRPDEKTADVPLVDSGTLDMDILPSLDATTDDAGGLQLRDTLAVQEPSGQPRGGKQTEEQEAMALPTLELSFEDPFDVAPNVMDPAERDDRLYHHESAADSADFGTVDKEVTEDAFEIVEQLENAESTRPDPEDMLPGGMMPRAGLETTRGHQPAGDTLDELTFSDFDDKEDLAFEFQGSATNTDDDAGLLDDANPFQFDLDEMDLDAELTHRNQGAQHESMPGRLTLELDAGAMSMELSSTTSDIPVVSHMSETERRSMALRLDTEAITDVPLADDAFTSLADTVELDDTPQGAQSGHLTLELDFNAISAQLPPGTLRPDEAASRRSDASSAPTLQGTQSQDDEDELLLDLDDLDVDDNPRPS